MIELLHYLPTAPDLTARKTVRKTKAQIRAELRAKGSSSELDLQTREEIYEMYKTGQYKQTDIARKYGIGRCTVQRIQKRDYVDM